MELMNKHVSTPVQSWINRTERKHPPKVDYHSELRTWLQHAILEAERNKDSGKKDLLLSFLKDLQNFEDDQLNKFDMWRKE